MLSMSSRNTAVRISRVLRCASQRSIQAKMARTSRMLKAANAIRHKSVQRNRSGRATVMPIRMPAEQKNPTIVDTSTRPNTM